MINLELYIFLFICFIYIISFFFFSVLHFPIKQHNSLSHKLKLGERVYLIFKISIILGLLVKIYLNSRIDIFTYPTQLT